MSPDIAVPATPGSIALSFRHSYHTESNFDGSVLEVKVGAGGFQDVLAAGGSFVESDDNRTLASGFGNPIGGRQAWRGTSGGFVTTTVSLPASPSGQTIQLRWRLGSDASVRGTGWYVDTIAFLAGSTCCVPSLPSVSPSSGSGPGPVTVSWTEDTGIQRTDAATIAGQTFTVTQVGPGNYFTVPPCRLVDTRQPGPSSGPIPFGTSKTFPVAGSCFVPTSATAVAFNVTVTSPTTTGNCRLYPGPVIPLVSTTDFPAGQTRGMGR